MTKKKGLRKKPRKRKIDSVSEPRYNSPMQIVTVQFDRVGKTNFDRLLSVFRKSINHHMPNVELVEYMIPAPERTVERARNLSDNSAKLAIWSRHMETTTKPVIFADCDMLCVGSAHHAFDPDFDIAFTKIQQKHRFPMNGGIIMARPTQAARDFFALWLEVNDRMFADPNFHCRWKSTYGGMNQAAFGYLYDKHEIPGVLHEYSTRIWNAITCDWQHLTDETVFIHFKSKLRNLVLTDRPPTGVYAAAMKLWYEERDR